MTRFWRPGVLAIRKAPRGFTLTELALVLFIVALLIGGLLIPLTSQVDLQRTNETLKTLEGVRDSLVGFAATNGRLPCPATGGTTGVEDPNTGTGICVTPHGGFVPGITLGISPVDAQGYVLDAWGQRIRYAVTTANSNAFTKPGQMRTTGMTTLDPDLRICSTGATMDQPGIPGSAICHSDGTTNALTNKAIVVVYSLGRNGSTGGTGVDERHNPNEVSGGPYFVAADRAFVSHSPAPAGAPNGEFDDIVIWLSSNILFNRMIAAGQLP